MEVGVDGASPVELNLKQVARQLGVHYMTVYRYVRSGRLPARRVGTAWVVDAADVAALVAHAAGDPTAPPVDHVARMRDRLVDGDESGAWTVAEAALVAGWDPEAVVVDLVSEAVRGVRPDDGPAAAHLAVVTATRVSASVGSRFRRRGRSRGSVVLGAPSGEAHSFGLAVIADVVRLRNFTVLELGGDVAEAAFVDATRRADRLVAVGIGVTGVEHLPAAWTVVDALRTAEPRVPVLVGGQAVANGEVAELSGADGWAPDARSLADLIEARVPARPRSRPSAPQGVNPPRS
jgi:excisionase family DNA binding protein